MADELPNLSAEEARILGCLIEKKEATPDIYPLSLNALQSAVNQKTSREPVMSMEPSDMLRTIKLLEQKGLVRQSFASRVERYEHLMAQKFALTQPQIAIVGLLMLRGQQTAYELLTRSERLARISSIEDLRNNLDLLIGRRPSLIVEIPRGPGQREDRFAHLLSGEPLLPALQQNVRVPIVQTDLEERVRVLEEQVADLTARLQALGA